MIYYYQYSSPLGDLMLASLDQTIVYCGQPLANDEGIKEETPYLRQIARQLDEYFQGKRTCFDVTFQFLNGTAFQQKVWQAVIQIPYGETRSYQEIAQAIGHPRAYRAVGSALRECPISILIPCHRVISASGRLGGYGNEIDKKLFLLRLEQHLC